MSTEAVQQPQSEQPRSTGRNRVRVWFGDHVVCDYRGDAEHAERYAAAMSRRFAGLRVTNDPIVESNNQQ